MMIIIIKINMMMRIMKVMIKMVILLIIMIIIGIVNLTIVHEVGWDWSTSDNILDLGCDLPY
jgi:hypothetical protein